jgi:hypothetical protein
MVLSGRAERALNLSILRGRSKSAAGFPFLVRLLGPGFDARFAKRLEREAARLGYKSRAVPDA